MSQIPPLVIPGDMAELLNVTKATINRWLRHRPEMLPPAFRIGARTYWRQGTVLEWIDGLGPHDVAIPAEIRDMLEAAKR